MTEIELNIVYDAFSDVKVTLPDGIAWSDVSDWYVKWDTIILIMGDNTIHKVSCTLEEIGAAKRFLGNVVMMAT